MIEKVMKNLKLRGILLMKTNLDNYFLELTEKLAFLTLEDVALDNFGEVPEGFSIPIFLEDIKAMGSSQEGLSTKQISTGMLYMIGIDNEFKFNEQYIEFLRRAIDKPDSMAAQLAMEKYELKSYKDAMIFMRAAIVLNEDAVHNNFNYAQLSLDFSRNTKNPNLAKDLVDEAERYFEKVLMLDKSDPLANFQLGLIRLDKNQDLEAKENIELALRFGDEEIKDKAQIIMSEIESKEVLFRVEELLEQGDYSSSLEELNKIEEENLVALLKYRILFLKGFCNKAVGNLEKAIENYEKAVEINNQDTLLLAELGVCYAYIGDFDQSLEFYMSALDIEKNSVEILNNISIVYLNMGNIEKAKEFIGYAKELSVNDEIVDATILKIREIEEKSE